MAGYVFGRTDLIAEQQECMRSCLDPITREHLESLGVAPGWSCLEVGAGGGSIARWLSQRVGSTGQVLATDLDVARTDPGEAGNMTVRRHDIVADELVEASFDLVHARLVLLHLPQRQRALEKKVRALKTGGWLLLDEFGGTWMPVLTERGAEVFAKSRAALHRLLTAAGADVEWGSRAYAALSSVVCSKPVRRRGRTRGL